MKIVILGGSGNFGAALVSIAESRGHEVALSFSRHPPPRASSSQAVQWDAGRSPPPLALRSFRPDVVVHSIAIVNPDECEARPDHARVVNAESVLQTVLVLEPSYFVYISSDYVFDGGTGGYTPESLCNPVNTYGETKLEGEGFARQAPRWLVVRTALFGSGLPAGLATRWEGQLTDLAGGKPVTLADDQMGTPLWTHTLAEAVMRLVEHRHEGTVHAAGPEVIGKAQLMRRLAARVGISDPPIDAVSTSSLSAVARRPLNASLGCSEVVRGIVGYPESLDDDIDRYASALGAIARQ